MSFDFKRGDTVRMQILDQKTGIIEEYPGLVIEVTEKEVRVRRDCDASMWDADLNGKRHNFVDGGQFLQLQKVFKPEGKYQGQRVTAAIVEVVHKEEGEQLYNVLNVRLFNNNKEIARQETVLDLESNHIYADFHKEYIF